VVRAAQGDGDLVGRGSAILVRCGDRIGEGQRFTRAERIQVYFIGVVLPARRAEDRIDILQHELAAGGQLPYQRIERGFVAVLGKGAGPDELGGLGADTQRDRVVGVDV